MIQVNIIQSRAREQCSTIKIKILLDAMRGSRGSINSSRTMLLPLLQQSPHCQVYFIFNILFCIIKYYYYLI